MKKIETFIYDYFFSAHMLEISFLGVIGLIIA